jgi:hypothetical protein
VHHVEPCAMLLQMKQYLAEVLGAFNDADLFPVTTRC